ncbi:MAG: metallophosphoesterase [Muribaculaceae bacterium]|nr:metallophosphoesterase [Muribaculaceae bacterium]
MRFFWVPFIAFLVINLLADWLIYRWLKRNGWRRTQLLHGIVSVALVGVLTALVATVLSQSGSNGAFVAVMWLLFVYLSAYIAKYIGLLVSVFAVIPGLTKRTVKFVHKCGVVGALAVAFLMLWSALVTPNTIDVQEVEFSSERVPEEFDGYKIVHFSDSHLGTYNGRTGFMEKCVKTMNELNGDVIVFTGDLVSRQTSEATPYREVLKELKAKDGIYSVLGNHDYDDYMNWPTEEMRDADRKALRDIEKNAGWRLLLDENVKIERGDTSIIIIGTENYGEPPFPKYGSLQRAYPDAGDDAFKILLQHNPQSWRNEIVGKTTIDLMLAGHTHAMQTMINFFGHKWSPAAWKYKEWGGMYREGSQGLYVNIGLGMVGIPARIGATPEITVITLKRM